MAQDSSAPSGNAPDVKQDVDIDELEVEILIIAKNASQLNQTAAFLTRRGWPTTVQTNISKAIEHVAEKKPDFVLVSFSHSNPAVTKLPDLIAQTFNLDCIGFVEGVDTSSQARLNNFKMRHKVQGSPSGPNIQRTIRKILAEKFNVKSDDGRSSAEGREREENGGGGTVTIRGNSSDRGDAAIIQSSSARDSSGTVVAGGSSQMVGGGSQSGRTKLSDLAGKNGPTSGGEAGEGDHFQADADTEVVSTGKYKMTTKNRKSLKELSGSQKRFGLPGWNGRLG
ncbi:MAG: hypothetical protein HC902_04385 [Calothrix sp. SM1_5_4]|nr:hypothetical protein [Calothrix sp. SM1_5_4]